MGSRLSGFGGSDHGFQGFEIIGLRLKASGVLVIFLRGLGVSLLSEVLPEVYVCFLDSFLMAVITAL